jgi:hypothetical protein
MKIRFSAGLFAGMVLLTSSAYAQFARQEVIALQSVNYFRQRLPPGEEGRKTGHDCGTFAFAEGNAGCQTASCYTHPRLRWARKLSRIHHGMGT